MTAVQKRNGAIDFWRFIFSICIVLCHVVYLNSYDKWTTSGNFWFANFRIGVEYFFLVSGFLMAKNIEKWNETEIFGGAGKTTLQFIGNKLKGFYPEYLFAFCLSLLVTNLVKGAYTLTFPENVYDLFLINFLGIGSTNFAVGGSWYLSAMILSMAILFPILYAKRETFLYCIAPLISLFFLGWLYKQEGALGVAAQWNGYCPLGMLRAIAELCLGCVAYGIAGFLSKYRFTVVTKILLTVVEFAGYIGTLFISALWAGKTDFFCLFLLFVAVIFSFSGQTYSVQIFSSRIFVKMGKFSLPLYLNHIVWARLLSTLNMPVSFPKELIVYLALSFASAFVCISTVGFIKGLAKKYDLQIKRCFVKI